MHSNASVEPNLVDVSIGLVGGSSAGAFCFRLVADGLLFVDPFRLLVATKDRLFVGSRSRFYLLFDKTFPLVRLGENLRGGITRR